MNDEETTPEDMPVDTGSNLLPSELALGQQGRTHIKDYERHDRSYHRAIAAMHEDIVGFGRVLLRGQEMYPSRKEFGYWIERRGLNTGKLAKHQTERTACMSIARLVEDGAEVDEHDDTVVPVKLDLSGCKLTTPTDIMKWARKNHRHLFPHLPPKKEKQPGETIAGEIKRELKADLAARDERVAELELELEAAREGQPLTLDELREQTVALLRDLPKEERRREVNRLMKALDLNIHDWSLGTIQLGTTPSKRKPKAKKIVQKDSEGDAS